MKKLFLIGLSIFILFGATGTILWFTVNNKYEKQETFKKVFKHNNVEQFIVNAQNTNVEVKKGKHLSIEYNGRQDVNASIENNLLHFTEGDTKNHFNANFIPFRKTINHLVITLPKKKYESFNITTNKGNISINNVSSNNSNIITDTGDITYDKVNLKHAKAITQLGSVNVNNAQLTEFNGEVKTGNIGINNSRLNNTELITSLGDININKLKSECNIKSSTGDGNIKMSYAKKPKNTMLDLQADSGETYIRNKAFKGESVGEGRHVVESYADNGDIVVK
ncbi:DUF4097 family beta strand repeat-containing protein [Mammaliicoccus sp. Dog046]|uniref:DUF4097 family beta strand repeat-containing protein n=1 Tax=Mammaliicoccus sp. Dog046 TaxID=3034233 RepID=UPI002B25E5C5|nr:DUF4097 family beta strand repeat-containing protein [Mammaliicoccus sp. Dog046]WQK86194.1 DUF4097 family beta strand repeat-containing protein [Mammaliicoccus sp. Dog046]